MEDTMIGVVVIGGLAVYLFVRYGIFGRDYGYKIPRTSTWGVGQRSVDECLKDAEGAIDHVTEVKQ